MAGSSLGQTRRNREFRRQLSGWCVSVAAHGIVSAAIVAEVLLALWFLIPPAAGRQQIVLASAAEPIELEAQPLATLPFQTPAEASAQAVAEQHIAELAAVDITPELAQQLLAPRDARDDAIAADWVLARVTQEIAAAERLSQEEQ
jgi:hypothetical protein